MTPSQIKSALRGQLKLLREEVAARDPDAGERLAERFPEKLLARYGPVVSAYWPLGSEINPRPLMARLKGLGAAIVLPRVEDEGLVFRQFESEAALVPGGFGLMEPPPQSLEIRPTLILLPLLGFDAEGNRLGYGKGHYDKAIAALRREGRAFLCGLAYDEQRVTSVPAEPHDVPLDWVGTPGGNLPLFLARAGGEN